VVDSLKTLFTPFIPFSSQRLHELLDYEGFLAGPLEFRDVEEEGETHTVLTGDYESWVGSWEPSQLEPGRKLREPEPLFKKLDAEQVVEDELERLEQTAEAASA
jgi:methionyl-tRNA synthetase